MKLVEKICPTCRRSFKVLEDSKQIYCTRICIEFRNGKQEKLNFKEMLDFKRNGFTHGFGAKDETND